MKYLFLINPAAGKNSPALRLKEEIEAECHRRNLDYECRITEKAGHARELTRQFENCGHLRVYGVGGDGTLNEIASAAAGAENVEIGLFSCGSGNDYIRTFGGGAAFLNVPKQLDAKSHRVDMIQSSTGEMALNICSLGLDAKVAYEMVQFKKLPMIGGSLAYQLALAKTFLEKLGTELQVVIDGEKKYTGRYLFVLAGCGRYYGGGFCGAPDADPGDGLLDFVLVKVPKLYRIPGLVGIYKRGEHLRNEKFQDILEFTRGTRIEIKSTSPAVVNFDGECLVTREIHAEIVPGAVRFLVP